MRPCMPERGGLWVLQIVTQAELRFLVERAHRALLTARCLSLETYLSCSLLQC